MTFAEQEFIEARKRNPLKTPAPARSEIEGSAPGTHPCTPADPLGMYGPAPGDSRALTTDEMADAAGYFKGFARPAFVGNPFVADRVRIKDGCGRVVMDTGEPGKAAERDSGRHYRYSYRGIKLDPYRIINIYRITHPAHQHALKKLLRAGKSVKSLRQDIKEVQDALTRWLEMLDEDEAHGD